MKFLIVILLTISLAVSGCDPVRRIDMVNKTKDTVRFSWTLNEDSLSGNPFFISNSSKLNFTLVAPKTAAIRMSFGAGSWSPAEVQKLMGFLESLEISSSVQKLRIDSLPQLKEFLLSRRKGLGGRRIEIAVTETILARQ